jgi:hypothetical protein
MSGIGANRLRPVILLALAAAACATNPATGERQLSLIGEDQEIAMGREADHDVQVSIGIYEDPELERYLDGVGQRLAARSERPDLPWTFRIADDPAVNAFALPGGFIYVTRGLLATLNTEAELAAVVGHEIGHVTARHAVNRISKAQLAGLGLGIGMILSPDLAQFSDLANLGLNLLFLKYRTGEWAGRIRARAGVVGDPPGPRGAGAARRSGYRCPACRRTDRHGRERGLRAPAGRPHLRTGSAAGFLPER